MGSKLGGVAGRASEILRSQGVRTLWFRVLGETVYRRMILFERLLDEPPADVSPGLAVTISQLQASEVDEYAAFRPTAVATEIRSRLERGHVCFVARREGAMVHSIWAAIGSACIGYLDSEIQLAPDEAYIYGSYTTPSLRRLNINAARAVVMARYFRERSFVRFLALVMPENPAGVGATVKSNYHHAAVIGRVKIGPWRRDFHRFVPGIRPVILIPHKACDLKS